MTRTMTASMPKYSARPPQTPAIMRSSRDLYRRRGPGPGGAGAAPPVGTSLADVRASEGSAPAAPPEAWGVVGSGSPAGVPACGVVVASSSFVSMAGSVPVAAPAHHWESSLGDGSGTTLAPGQTGLRFAPLRRGDPRS